MNVIKELWHGNIVPQDDARNNSKEMKELMGYMILAEASIFEYAFKFGMQIAIETLSMKETT